MTDLRRGANAALVGPRIEMQVDGARPGTVDLLVLLLGADGRVRSDADLVFFNQPSSPEGAVRLEGTDRVRVDTAAVPADVHRLAVAVALDDSVPGSLADVVGLGVAVADAGPGHRAPAEGLTTERAAVLVELYRRGADWKLRSVSQGWAGGPAALAREHGVTVDDTPPGPSHVVDQPVRTVPGEERLSPDERRTLDLRKREVGRVLLTKGAGSAQARVLLVVDKTGSLYRQYRNGTVHRVVERMVPVAVQLDDDGTLEAYLYATSFAKLPDLRVEDLGRWPAEYLHVKGRHGGIDYDRIGGTNDEIPILTEIIDGLHGHRTPTLVLFFTDGGFAKRAQIKKLLREASALPAFWQFVGLGAAGYGLLEELDTLSGRVLDNTGFFALDDIDTVSDAELYERLLGEFPDWLRAARAAGVLSP